MSYLHRNFTAHEVAMCYPLMEGQEYQELCQDVLANGLREKIELFQGKIIDGRNRLRACKDVGVEPQFKKMDKSLKDADLAAYVKSKNSHRRHIGRPERLKAAADLLMTQYAQTRLGESPQRCGRDPEKTVKQVALVHGVGARTLEKQLRVQRQGAACLQNALKKGSLSLNKASQLAGLSAADQAREVKNLESRIRRSKMTGKPVSKARKPSKDKLRKDAHRHLGNLIRCLESLGVFPNLRKNCRAITKALK